MITAGQSLAGVSPAQIGAARLRMVVVLVLVGASVLAGCGDDDSSGTPHTPTESPPPTATAPPANLAPVLAPIGDHTVVLGSDLLIPVTATDPEGQPVTLAAAGVPANAYFLPDSGIYSLFADDEGQLEQPLEVTFTASDGSASSSQTIHITVVRPDAPAQIALGQQQVLAFDAVGALAVVAGQTLTVQLAASGVSPLTYRAFPEPALAPSVTFDNATGLFKVSPPAELAGRTFEITFQACKRVNDACDAIVQLHQTVLLTVEPAPGAGCPDYVPPDCTELPSNSPPTRIDRCYKITTGGTYVFRDYVNII